MLIKFSAQHDIGGFSTRPTSTLLSLKIELMRLSVRIDAFSI